MQLLVLTFIEGDCLFDNSHIVILFEFVKFAADYRVKTCRGRVNLEVLFGKSREHRVKSDSRL